ncbi:oligomeric Golgi complex subunit 8 [Myxozyma melibiosi]|uniref:Conserved oligomeric Golgi complex subunit 8 n=1 Tax=Myxozyma melibiosi TaxID=54550 RepID=A0ABR1F814_9ASCO
MDSLAEIIAGRLPKDLAEQVKSGKSANEYLRHLRELQVDSLSSESATLNSNLQSIDRSLTKLAIESRPNLIATSATLESFTKGFNSLTTSLPDLSHAMPSLEEDVVQFEPINDRGASATLFSNVDKVLDILELPTLILTCVRNGYYAEALDLVGHVRRLAIRYRNAKVLAMIQDEVDKALLEMTTSLLRLLRENVQLPTAIKVISYLKRLQPFQSSENSVLELQHIFLLSRSIHLKSQLKSLEPLQSLPEKYLRRYIEFFREFVFAAIIGFRSIFPKEGDTGPIRDRVDDQLLHDESKSTIREAAGVTVDSGEQLLSSFIYVVTIELRQTVKQYLPLISDKSVYSALYLQIIYASQSLARVGGEFWSILADDEDLQFYASGDDKNPWISALEKQRELSKKLKPS